MYIPCLRLLVGAHAPIRFNTNNRSFTRHVYCYFFPANKHCGLIMPLCVQCFFLQAGERRNGRKILIFLQMGRDEDCENEARRTWWIREGGGWHFITARYKNRLGEGRPGRTRWGEAKRNGARWYEPRQDKYKRE